MICPCCNSEFEQKHKGQVYCSKRCRKIAHKRRQRASRNPHIEITCCICGNATYKGLSGPGGRKPKTCGSLKCVKKHKYNCRKNRKTIHRLDVLKGLKKPYESELKKINWLKRYERQMMQESRILAMMLPKIYSRFCIICGKEYKSTEITMKHRKYCSTACRERAKILKNPMMCFIRKHINSMCKKLKQRKFQSYTATVRHLPYTPNDFKSRIESTWEPGMSWDNYGQWHIDHIMPASIFNGNDMDSIKACFGLDNLQALWATTAIAQAHGSSRIGNLNKSNRLELIA